MTHVVRRTLNLLERFALARGFEPPVVYNVIIFHDFREVNVKRLHQISEDVFVDERGAIVVKFTEILPLLVERISTGYYALCLLKAGKQPTADEAKRLAVSDLLEILSLLAYSTRGLH